MTAPSRRPGNRMTIGCAILAAGNGSRFGRPAEKLVTTVYYKPLLQHAIDAASASSASTCSLVLGAASDMVRAWVDPRRCAVLFNADWKEGMAGSLRCAVANHLSDDGCIIMLGDQPHVTADDLGRLMIEFSREPRSIVALRSRKIWGAPVLFGRSEYASLLQLQGDTGAKKYARQTGRLRFVEASCTDAFEDVDSKADMKALTRSR
jgi:molybdenum cofactor cytidylyltransferase